MGRLHIRGWYPVGVQVERSKYYYMSSFVKNNQKIAKNTLLLYVRMIIVLVVGLYTSRVILDTLGVVDYGIYNVVGGLVVLFSYLDSALSQAVTRFYSYELPHGLERVNVVFNSSIILKKQL